MAIEAGERIRYGVLTLPWLSRDPGTDACPSRDSRGVLEALGYKGLPLPGREGRRSRSATHPGARDAGRYPSRVS